MSELPKGWVSAKLGDYIHLKNGFAFKSKDYSEPSNMTVPVIRISDINGKVASDKKANHVPAELAVSEFEIAKGDLLVAMSGATTGKIGVYGGSTPAYQNQRVGNLKLNAPELSDLGFRNHLIKYLSPTILEIAYGGAQPNISASGIENIGVCFPPLAEQKRIVEKLDEVLAQVDTIKARLDGIPAILKRFRQSVLAAAVSGKLISVAEPLRVKIGDIVTDIRYGTSKKCDYKGGQTPVIRIPNIGDRKLDISDLKSADFTDKELKTLALRAGDLLVIRSNGSLDLVAKPALVDDIYEGFLYAGYLIRIRCNQEKVLPQFLLNVLSSRVVRDVVELGARSTSGVNNINSKELAALEFVLPAIQEQKEIVRLVDQYFAFADTIETQVKKAQARVDKLTQSILAKAFRGELVPQDPNDEPADKLLERIAAARKEAEVLAKAAKKAEAAKKRAAKSA
ncbi:restriction endonuclease subunit S [Vibrio aestuarianus]|uniref:restriction endonuclease subunit S n=1 Tax=Vibrio aestuarianus TaxID=28171 RepID=UPI00237CBD3D|nr:restriction endonuclease subunit S [Vibrio aestuarianus]MDE1339809.1 restriction endonuclease subunit S [Vibrio aestuarianus]